MSHVRYDKWADYICGLVQDLPIPFYTVVDLACGTGSLAHNLSNRGLQVIGVDIATAMLSEAAAKQSTDPPPLFLHQPLWSLDLYGTVDVACCTLDGFNYITDEAVLQKAFARAFLFLNPGGYLVFDVRTLTHYKQTNGCPQESETANAYCVWTPTYKAHTSLCTTKLHLFERQGTLWRRYRETHVQRYYAPETLVTLLTAVGFTNISQYHPFTNEPPLPTDDRVFFRAQKPQA